MISRPLLKPPSFATFNLHCTKICECFYVFFAIHSSHLQNSSLIELLSFDLKVLQVLFSVKEKNTSLFDSQLHFCHCILFELIVFIVSKAILNSKFQSIILVFLSFFENKIVSTIALKEK